jgi:hypothetical protein
VKWQPFQHGGITYDLTHLHPRTFRFERPAEGNRPAEIYNVQTSFTSNCFTRAPKATEVYDASLIYPDSNEVRIFDPRRYEMSKHVATIIQALPIARPRHNGGRGKFFSVELIVVWVEMWRKFLGTIWRKVIHLNLRKPLPSTRRSAQRIRQVLHSMGRRPLFCAAVTLESKSCVVAYAIYRPKYLRHIIPKTTRFGACPARKQGRGAPRPHLGADCCASECWTRSSRLILSATMPERSTTCSPSVPADLSPGPY